MLAFIYLLFVFVLGDAVSRCFLRFRSLPHRLAVAFLCGSLLSACFTYLSALVFASTSSPLLWANLVYFAAAGSLIYLLRRGEVSSLNTTNGLYKLLFPPSLNRPSFGDDVSDSSDNNKYVLEFDAHDRPPGNRTWDTCVLILLAVFGIWLMFAMLDFRDGNFLFAIKGWSDFGANLSLSQSFALGNNFPTEHPFLSGEPIRYHFMFWFLGANLSYLGLNLVWSINILSLLSWMSLVALTMTLAEVLFRSRVVARISVVFLVFSASALTALSFIWNQPTLATALQSIWNLRDFIGSGYGFRGDGWGALSVNIFANQRHLIGAAAILLISMIAIIEWLVHTDATVGETVPIDTETVEPESETVGDEIETVGAESETVDAESKIADAESDPPKIEITKPWILIPTLSELPELLFCGCLIGLLPFWNSAVFVSALIAFGSIFLLCTNRLRTLIIVVTALAIGMPQVWLSQIANPIQPAPSLFYFGWIVANPTIPIVLEYIGWTFGFKILLFLIALIFVPGTHRRLMLAFSSLVVAVFIFQFSVDIFNNHKLLNIWNILMSGFFAYALYFIWKKHFVGQIAAVALALLVTLTSVIDLFPVHNDGFVSVPHENDRLTNWVLENTAPSSVFLSDRYLSHPILFSGRKLFFGNPLFPWAAGYDTQTRENLYRQMFQETNPDSLIKLLQDNGIDYVAIDGAIRSNGFIKNVNESTYQENFEKVFEDTDHAYGNLTIYRVPKTTNETNNSISTAVEKVNVTEDQPAVTAFNGGAGSGKGLFDRPRGIAVDKAGNFYVADTMNARIQKFSPDGINLTTFGNAEIGNDELREPNGIAVNDRGSIYVADALSHRVYQFAADGKILKQWTGPEPGFFGPRDIRIGPNKQLYVLDQGRSRVVAFDPESERVWEWGRQGPNEGEFVEPTGLDVSGDRVYVADTGNNRIQIFDLTGKFIQQWPVPEWNSYPWQYPDVVFEPVEKKLYVTNPQSREILVFDATGNRLEPLRPAEPDALDSPSALALSNSKTGKRLYVLNTGNSRVYFFDLNTK